ncbi:amidohydrolase family protein [Mycobacterium sp. AZCC_0083]|uniref:amidohydrolase family protein n=1 Tax=Mycobacterium sp. AZCC_0083 TaxID=2735882 RepID=UPI0018488B61|nr:amidohydrolase family protein [Mycobacterium sp. AZCC_0083]MBB5168519.1 aminocarboxymuconate-semialdehyde decarboxylase [Mycobacterium sp. AZCC_0083]
MSFTVDIHHHLIPDFYRAATEHDGQSVGGVLPATWSQANALSFMDDAGIDVAIASISAPGVHLGDDAAALSLARRCNDYLAEMVRGRPDRFGGFAILPLPDVDTALGELTRALDELGLDGVVLMTNALGLYLGEPQYRPLFQELQRRGAVVFIHPTMSPDPSSHRLGFPDSLLDFPVDTARTVAQMHFNGVFAANPDVKFVLSHAGGVVPYLARRFAVIDEMAVIPDDDQSRGSAADTFRRLYWDTALAWSDPTLHTLRAVAGLDHVLYGSDYPYLRRDIAIRGRGELENSAELSDSERAAILHGAALTLLPRLITHPRLAADTGRP